MLERLKQIVAQHIALSETKGIFLSGFSTQGDLLVSSGVLTTDKSIGQVIDMLYHGLLEWQKNIDHIIVDIIQAVETVTSPELLSSLNMQTHGIALTSIDHTKSGVMLPATMGVNSAGEALSLLKKKHNIEWNIVMYTFTTMRLMVK